MQCFGYNVLITTYHHLALESQICIVNFSMENYYEEITQNSICNLTVNKFPNTGSIEINQDLHNSLSI